MTKHWPMLPLAEVAPLVRRPVEVDTAATYREIGIRSFAKGVFHKAPVTGLELGSKRVFAIKPGDLLFNIVFAWEGAVAVAGPSEDGMIGSHRFLTCVAKSTHVDPAFLFWWFSRGVGQAELLRASPGGAGRNRTLGIEKLGAICVPVPPLAEQKRIIARIEGLATGARDANLLRSKIAHDLRRLLLSAFSQITQGAPKAQMQDIAPLIRRPVALSFDTRYPELGIRSFFKGTFHKPSLSALELGSKRVFWIETGDLLFSNVFAWEGAIAIAKPGDGHRVGSHRYITCVPKAGIAEARFLLQYFQTNEGFSRIQDASPGGAGRNRTLSLEALMKIEVPVPSIDKQRWFAEMHAMAEHLLAEQEEVGSIYDALTPALLERMFRAPEQIALESSDRLVAHG
ncbi:hypothetical protein JJB98_11720 [Bradyrhizobium diazoefficiens]|nr:hypothetical protein [Bradyrhizobium diazoefficiens]QQO20535.1 hypothetical protein JJB98_11720 [Bradyrhizobium diazoefficiens]